MSAGLFTIKFHDDNEKGGREGKGRLPKMHRPTKECAVLGGPTARDVLETELIALLQTQAPSCFPSYYFQIYFRPITRMHYRIRRGRCLSRFQALNAEGPTFFSGDVSSNFIRGVSSNRDASSENA